MALPTEYISKAYKESLKKPDETYAHQVLRRLCVMSLLSELKPIHEYVAECEEAFTWLDPQTVADATGQDVGEVERGMSQIYQYGLFVRHPSDVEGVPWVYQTDVQFRRKWGFVSSGNLKTTPIIVWGWYRRLYQPDIGD